MDGRDSLGLDPGEVRTGAATNTAKRRPVEMMTAITRPRRRERGQKDGAERVALRLPSHSTAQPTPRTRARGRDGGPRGSLLTTTRWRWCQLDGEATGPITDEPR
jgi:hypothetical protein